MVVTSPPKVAWFFFWEGTRLFHRLSPSLGSYLHYLEGRQGGVECEHAIGALGGLGHKLPGIAASLSLSPQKSQGCGPPSLKKKQASAQESIYASNPQNEEAPADWVGHSQNDLVSFLY